MKVLLDMVISPNGKIAREDGDEDWLPHEGWEDMLAEVTHYGNIIVGRETFELVNKNYTEENFDYVNAKLKVIVSRDNKFSAPEGYMLARSPEEAIRRVEAAGLNTAYLIGGGKLNGSFAKAGLIDELRLTIVPYVIGCGRDVFGSAEFDMPLRLKENLKLADGRVKLVYEIVK